MLGPIGGNSGFDVPFLVLQVLMIVGWMFGFLLLSRLPAWSLGAASVLAIGGIVAIPVYWYLAYPPASGIEGAGRLLFLVPLITIHAGLAGTVLYKLATR